MRVSFFYIVTVLFVLSYGSYASAQAGSVDTFTTNLSLGSRGMQVIALQKILNQDQDTRIMNTGPGSPGNETNYFGQLTKTAVIKFQEKYASETLASAGLTRGSGYVGVYTRAKLNSLSIPISYSTVTPPASTSVSQNPNLKNLDKFLIALEDVAKKQGSSATDIATIKKEVMKVTATTTDLQATFEEMVRK